MWFLLVLGFAPEEKFCHAKCYKYFIPGSTPKKILFIIKIINHQLSMLISSHKSTKSPPVTEWGWSSITIERAKRSVQGHYDDDK